jgi:hypothetical protein
MINITKGIIMNKNVMSLAIFGLLVAAPAQAAFEAFRGGLNRAGLHASNHKAAYGLVALAAFNQFMKKDIQDAAKRSASMNGKSIVHIGDKLVELAPLAFAIAVGNLSEHGLSKSARSMYDLATFQSKETDKFGTFLGSGTTLFATTGAAYSVYKHFRQ